MIILRENTQGPYNKRMCFPLLKCIGYFSPSYDAEICLPHTERAFFFWKVTNADMKSNQM